MLVVSLSYIVLSRIEPRTKNGIDIVKSRLLWIGVLSSDLEFNLTMFRQVNGLDGTENTVLVNGANSLRHESLCFQSR